MKNIIDFLNGKIFKVSQRDTTIMNQGGSGLPEMKRDIVSIKVGHGHYEMTNNYEQFISHNNKVYLYSGCKHYNGHFSNYKEGVYEVYGKLVKGMTTDDYNNLENHIW